MKKWSVTRRERAAFLAIRGDDFTFSETERLLDELRSYVEDRSISVLEVACKLGTHPSFGLTGLLAALEGQAEGLGKRVRVFVDP